jgi:hypothetical protein
MAKIRKKTIFFSIISLLIIMMFLASIRLLSNAKTGESEIEIIRTKVKLLNYEIRDMENTYFDKLVYMSAKNSLIGLSKYYYDNNFEPSVIQKGIQFAMQDVMDDGILKNMQNMSINLSGSYINNNYTNNGMIKNISFLFGKIGLNVKEFKVTLSSYDAIKQIDPWTIQVKANIEYYFADNKNIASWKGFTTRTVNIPVYGIYTMDKDGNKGIITNVTWHAENMSSHGEPSVVDRLSGITTDTSLKNNGICITGCYTVP